jgi:hypothetical protein
MDLPSGNDQRLMNNPPIAAVGDQQTGTRQYRDKREKAKQAERIPAAVVRGKVYKGQPGQSFLDMIGKIPDGAFVGPNDLGYIDPENNTFSMRSEEIIKRVLDEVAKTKPPRPNLNFQRKEQVASSLFLAGNRDRNARPGFSAKVGDDKHGRIKFQAMHPDQLRKD